MRRRGSGYFQDAPNSSQRLTVGSTALLFLQQKGNRCAVMSTVDYSRNIAPTRKKRNECAPAALRVVSVSALLGGRSSSR